MRRSLALLAVMVVPLWLGACGSDDTGGAIDGASQEATSTTNGGADADADATVGLANPASVFCEEQGGTEVTYMEPEGEFGICEFDDGTECESFAFMRGECKQGDHEEAPERAGATKVR